MSNATVLPAQYRGKPANLLFALEYADALGISRINALTSIHVIEGKPSASADLIAGMIRNRGHKLRITGDDQSATAQLIRLDDPDFTFEVTWTLERARTAGLLGKGGNWIKYPAAMLRSRAITEVARMGASDVLSGVIYTPEELGAVVDQEGNLVSGPVNEPQRVESHQVQPSRPAPKSSADVAREALGMTAPAEPERDVDAEAQKLGAAIEQATTKDELRELWTAAGSLTPDYTASLRANCDAKAADLDALAAAEQAQAEETLQTVLDAEIIPEAAA
jgi:hypothetical protein